jgi:hypothetical protein
VQHIPNKGEHQIRYFGWYSNKKRGLQLKKIPKPEHVAGGKIGEPDTSYRRTCRMKWAALIKAVYEEDPLKCLNCGGAMRIVSFIEKHQSDVVEKILRHCGLWKKAPPRAPPKPEPGDTFEEPALDYGFFDREIS